jgi:flagellar hook-associated protein 3 FlgL
MRVTTRHMYEDVLRNVQNRLSDMDRAQQQTGTGRRNAKISDDPLAGAQVLRSDRTLRAIVQYRRGVTAVRSRLDTAEAALGQVTDILSRAKELATGQSGSNANAATRSVTAIEVDSLLKQAIAMGNSRVGSEFVFGGTITDVPPFQANGTYTGTAASRQVEIGAGQVIDIAPSGQALFVNSGVITALTNLRDRLLADDAAGVTASIVGLDSAVDQVQSSLAGVGADVRRLDATMVDLDALDDTMLKARSDAADIPLEEAAMHLAAVQAALQAAVLSGSKLLDSNLLQYYR